MTARELINNLQALGEKNLDREVVMFDGPTWYTPFKIEILSKTWGKLESRILID